jgi:hypothetical protein
VDEINPRQPFLRINVFGWREMFRIIKTSSCDVDLVGPSIGLICQRCPTLIAERSPRAGVGSISARRTLHELELRTFDYDPGYCLSSGGAPAVSTMAIRANPDVRRCAEAHLATITAARDLVRLHSGQYKFVSDRTA